MPESILAFSMSEHWLNDSMFCHFAQQRRASVGFRPSTRWTSDLPNTNSDPSAACNTWIWEAVFWNYSLWLRVKRQVPDLWVNGVQSAVLRYSLNKWQNMKNYFSVASLILRSKRWFHNLFLKQCSKACICGNKSNQVKNIRSCFYLAVLITWCSAAFSQPLH